MADIQKWQVHFQGPLDSSGRRTGQKVAGPYASRQRARNKADKLDNEYGAYRHSVLPYGEGHDMKIHGEGKEHGDV